MKSVITITDPVNEFFFRTLKDSSLLEGTEYRVVDTEDGQVASVTLTLDPDEEVYTTQLIFKPTPESNCHYILPRLCYVYFR